MRESKTFCDECHAEITRKKQWHLQEQHASTGNISYGYAKSPERDLDFCSLACLAEWIVKQPVKK